MDGGDESPGMLSQHATRTESRLARRIKRYEETKAANTSLRPVSAKERLNGKQVIEEALALLKPRPSTAHEREDVDVSAKPLAGKLRAARHREHINTSKYFLEQRAQKRREKEKRMEQVMQRERWKRQSRCDRHIKELNRWATEEGIEGKALDSSLRHKNFTLLKDEIDDLGDACVRVTTVGGDGQVKYERLLDVVEFEKLYLKHKNVMENQIQELQAKRTYMGLCATTSGEVQANLESLLRAAEGRTEELQRQMNYITACGWNL